MPQYPKPICSKLPNVGTTIFTVMSRLAAQHNAINLSQGFPDFRCADGLIDMVDKHMRAGHNQYAPMAGVVSLREAIARKVQDLYGASYHPEDEITVTAGATQAIFTAVAAMVRPGDEVIVFEPVYDSYVPSIELNGGRAVYVRQHFPDYRIDWEEVKRAITPKTRMIMLNTPHNPTASVLSANDMRKLEALTRNTDIVIVSDEVYEHIVFDGLTHQSVARFPGLAERSFIISSFGKTYHITGWKIGYCLAPQELMGEFRKAHQFNVFVANHPIQLALAEFMANSEHYLQLADFYQKKRDFFRSRITGSRFKLLPSCGTYFQSVRYDAITDQQDTDFAVRMTKESGVASIPVSVFYREPVDHKVLRFCFAKNEETLERAAEILCRI